MFKRKKTVDQAGIVTYKVTKESTGTRLHFADKTAKEKRIAAIQAANPETSTESAAAQADRECSETGRAAAKAVACSLLEDSTAQVAVVTNKGPVSTVKVVRPEQSPAAKEKAALKAKDERLALLEKANALFRAGRTVEALAVMAEAEATKRPPVDIQPAPAVPAKESVPLAETSK